MDTAIFKELGFTERETKVYTTLLEYGTSTVGPLSEHCGLPRAKVYETITRLIDKGLVSYIIISKTKHFQAAPAKTIIELLDERKRALAIALGELEAKQKHHEHPQTAIVHEGYNAVKARFDRLADELTPRETYYAFAFKNDYKHPGAPHFFRAFHFKLAEKKITDKILASQEVRNDVKKAYEKNNNIAIKFITRNTPLGVCIIPGKIIQLVWGERPTAIEITSPQIHHQYKQFFEEMWKEAKT